MKFSAVIPTKNRSECLEKLLNSILEQSILPYEIIVVDDSDNLRTRQLIHNFRKFFVEKNVKIRYFKRKQKIAQKIVSISSARNFGAKKARGDIVIFFDDDVVLEKNYLKEILRVFEEYPQALGVQGLIVNASYSHFWNSVKKVFFYWHADAEKCKMLPSGKTTFAFAPKNIITCEWLFGLNVAYKKQVFNEFCFNEKLLGYSLGEDKEFSYKIYKKYPESLFLTPYARALHLPPQIRNLSKLRENIVTAYPISFFYNNIEQTLKNKLIFIWSEIGRIILRVIWALPNVNGIKNIITSYVDTVRHIKNVKKEDFSFIFNG
jgi:glycosyltransferase involved in cell wall biosynthesis